MIFKGSIGVGVGSSVMSKHSLGDPMRKLSPNSYILRNRTALGESLKVISNTVENSAGAAISSHPFPNKI